MIAVLTQRSVENKRMADPWTQSLIITFPKKGKLQLCQHYRTISLISNPSKVMLKVVLRGPNPKLKRLFLKNRLAFEPGEAPQNDLQSQNPVRKVPST